MVPQITGLVYARPNQCLSRWHLCLVCLLPIWPCPPRLMAVHWPEWMIMTTISQLVSHPDTPPGPATTTHHHHITPILFGLIQNLSFKKSNSILCSIQHSFDIPCIIENIKLLSTYLCVLYLLGQREKFELPKVVFFVGEQICQCSATLIGYVSFQSLWVSASLLVWWLDQANPGTLADKPIICDWTVTNYFFLSRSLSIQFNVIRVWNGKLEQDESSFQVFVWTNMYFPVHLPVCRQVN